MANWSYGVVLLIFLGNANALEGGMLFPRESESRQIPELEGIAVIDKTRSLDINRPVTFVTVREYNRDHAAQYVDILCINRYYAWYSDTGHTEVIKYQLTDDLNNWYNKFKKPVIITEYGADTISGLHTLPSFVFTEDYQVQFLEEYHKIFDIYRKKFLVGEMVWNFADFMTVQGVGRVVGNKKGVLTRQRQPKEAAYLMRHRYWNIINQKTLSNHRYNKYTKL
ncbi:hypothetical protein CAPTEDRAFT_225458 [Capitella teleta]|uniref:Glycoside hydrolase family 2 catalytic domain-containing protein n=1 Tax=Capitella teleta TaxID=283909 RepID=R7VJL1_CAPTE|nr:hypothetical protein CAPTEDRAFT_225458 [Capitella teleta]|eukprot:ELU16576.1 hypothetical protein CAPTEDRAFT_225458 [Capitella teleta]